VETLLMPELEETLLMANLEETLVMVLTIEE
jgi:hypothetical protein